MAQRGKLKIFSDLLSQKRWLAALVFMLLALVALWSLLTSRVRVTSIDPVPDEPTSTTSYAKPIVSHGSRSYRWLAALAFTLLSLVALLSLTTSQVSAASVYLVPDKLGLGGYSMTINNGNPVLAYYSSNTNNIVVAACGNPSCETALTIINPIESIALNTVAITVVNGNPFIAYATKEYPSVSHLRVAACLDPLCSQSPVITTLDSGDFRNMAITLQNGKALIAYVYPSVNGDHNIVKLVMCNDATCTTSTTQPLSITDGIYGYDGMGLGLLNGNPVLAYRTWQAGFVINLLNCVSPTCAETPTVKTFDVKTVDENASSFTGIALTVAANKPIITYTVNEYPRSWLKVATCTDLLCTGSMNIHIVDQVNYAQETSVSLVNGLPMIAYSNFGVRIATCLDVACNYASSTLIADDNHRLPQIQASYNDPVVVVLQVLGDTSYQLKVYFGGDFYPTQSPTASATSTARNPTYFAQSATPTRATLTPSITPTPSITYTPSITPIPSMTYTPSITPTPSMTYTPSITPTPTNTATDTPTITLTPTPTLITPTSAVNAAPPRNFYTTLPVKLTWNAVSWATAYKIEITDLDFGSIQSFTQVVPANTLSYSVDMLANGTYYWHVMALGGKVETWSTIESFVVSAPASATPSG